MSYLLTGMLVAYILVGLGLITLLLYYASMAYQCDALVGFVCYTDWKCDETLNSLPSGTYDAAGNLVPGDKIGCHINAMFGVDPGEGCEGYTPREIYPCFVTTGPDVDRSDINNYTGAVLTTTFACDPDSDRYDPSTGLCYGQFNSAVPGESSNNITGINNNSNAAGPGLENAPQAGLGLPPVQPFDCSCYFGANVIANGGTQSANDLDPSADKGGKYNISAMACGRLTQKYAPS